MPTTRLQNSHLLMSNTEFLSGLKPGESGPAIVDQVESSMALKSGRFFSSRCVALLKGFDSGREAGRPTNQDLKAVKRHSHTNVLPCWYSGVGSRKPSPFKRLSSRANPAFSLHSNSLLRTTPYSLAQLHNGAIPSRETRAKQRPKTTEAPKASVSQSASQPASHARLLLSRHTYNTPLSKEARTCSMQVRQETRVLWQISPPTGESGDVKSVSSGGTAESRPHHACR